MPTQREIAARCLLTAKARRARQIAHIMQLRIDDHPWEIRLAALGKQHKAISEKIEKATRRLRVEFERILETEAGRQLRASSRKELIELLMKSLPTLKHKGMRYLDQEKENTNIKAYLEGDPQGEAFIKGVERLLKYKFQEIYPEFATLCRTLARLEQEQREVKLTAAQQPSIRGIVNEEVKHASDFANRHDRWAARHARRIPDFAGLLDLDLGSETEEVIEEPWYFDDDIDGVLDTYLKES